MDRVTTVKSDATEISGFTYTLDLTGNRMSMAITGTAYTPAAVGYTYDNAYQLMGEARTGGDPYSQAFTYDPRGDRTNKVLTDAGTGQEIKGAGSGDYFYDESGNVTRTDDGVNVNVYSYDSEGYLTSYHHTGVGGEINVSYAYDADKRRIRKTVGTTTTRYFYDGSDVVEDYDGGGNLLASYVTPGLDNNLSVTIGSNTYYYLKDGLGSVRNIINSSQTTVNTYDYYAYGAPLGSYSQGITNRYTYTGREYDSESGLYYYRARYYNGDGRFLSTDPVEPWMYGYVGNRPANLRDPLGLISEDTLKSYPAFSKSEPLKIPVKWWFDKKPGWASTVGGGNAWRLFMALPDDSSIDGGIEHNTLPSLGVGVANAVFCLYIKKVSSTYGTGACAVKRTDYGLAWTHQTLNAGVPVFSGGIAIEIPLPYDQTLPIGSFLLSGWMWTKYDMSDVPGFAGPIEAYKACNDKRLIGLTDGGEGNEKDFPRNEYGRPAIGRDFLTSSNLPNM